MLFWLLACGSEEATSEIAEEDNSSKETVYTLDSPKTKEEVIVDLGENSTIALTLPTIEGGAKKGKQCFLQEMSPQNVGITGVTYTTKGDGLQLIRLRLVEEALGKDLNTWLDCENLGTGYFSKPVVEIAGVDVQNSKEEPFNGMNWVNLPEGIAFSYPEGIWLFEAWLEADAKDIDVSISIDTIPRENVKSFAGIVEMDLGIPSEDSKQSFTCPWEEEVSIVSVLGYAYPYEGSFAVSCDNKEVYSVNSKEFASDPPPIGNFSDPISTSEFCRVTCDWKTKRGSICTASIVAYPLKKSLTCVTGKPK